MAEQAFVQFNRDARDQLVVTPLMPMDDETLRELPLEREAKIEITFPRNLKFHKKFFALLHVIYDYMGEARRAELNIWSEKELLNRLKIDLGLYTLFIVGPGSTLPEGTPVYQPDSISFAKMDDTSFGKFYKGVIGVAIGKYVFGQNEASMMRAVDAVLSFE